MSLLRRKYKQSTEAAGSKSDGLARRDYSNRASTEAAGSKADHLKDRSLSRPEADESPSESMAMAYDMQRRSKKRPMPKAEPLSSTATRDIAPEMAETENHPSDMSDRIMKRRMSKGGMIDLAGEEMEHANAYYERDEDALDEKWDDSIERHSDEDSHGMDEDYHSPADMDEAHPDMQEDVVDHLDRIMARMSKKSRR